MRKIYSLILILLSYSTGFAQFVFESNPAGGVWTAGTTWTCRNDLVDCTGAPAVPGATDIALISSNSATAITVSGAISVGDIYFMSDVAINKVKRPTALGSANITINGQLVGILPDLSVLATPANAVFENSASLTLTFTGVNGLDPVITSWGFNAPLPKTVFSPAGPISVESFSVRQPLTVSTGTLEIASTNELRDAASSSLTVSAGATLNVDGSIGKGTDPSLSTNRFNLITVNGTMNTAADSYVNSVTFNLGSTGILNVGFLGANQTQGWWYQSNSPGGSSVLNAASTVNYNANAVQNVAAGITYGNLSLSSTTSAIKTLSGSGLTIQGNLTVGANVTSSPSSLVQFTGASAQSISGAGTLNFDGGLQINKTVATILTLNKSITITGGLTVTSGTFHLSSPSTISGSVSAITVPSSGTLELGDVPTTLTGGAVSVDGAITSGTSGTLTVSGASTFSGAGTLTLNNLTTSVTTGAATINNSAWSITGNIVNNGSLSLPSNTTLTFTGGSLQTISGSAFSIGIMVLNKTSNTLSNNGNVTLLRSLSVISGTLDADGSSSGNFILNSDVNGDAYIGNMAGGSIIDQITFKRYFDNSNNSWRNISFPVSSVTTAQLGASISLAANSLASYTESTPGNFDQGWAIAAIPSTLTTTKGYSAWMYNATPQTISIKASLLKGTRATAGSPYNFGVTFTDDVSQPNTQDGWNLIPNPFACPIDWNAIGWTKTNVNPSAAVWDAVALAYNYTGLGWDGIVAQGQAFWVQTTAASPNLACIESVKATNSNPTFYRVGEKEVDSRLLISLKSKLHEDKAMIQFKDGSGTEYDGNFDVPKLKNMIFNLSTMTNGGSNLAINVLPKSICTSVIKLNIANIDPGFYTLNFTGLSSFTDVSSIALVDKFGSKNQVLTDGGLYTFEVTSDSKSYGADRFEIRFNFMGLKSSPAIRNEEDKLISSSHADNQWYFDGKPLSGATGQSIKPYRKGVYYVVVDDGGCALRSENIVVNEGPSRLFPNPASETLKVDVYAVVPEGQQGEIVIYSQQGQIIRRQYFTSKDEIKEVDIEGMQSGSYIIKIISETGIILETSKVLIK